MLISHLPTIMFFSSVLALMFTSFERISMYVRDKDDGLNGINAAALTGARELLHFLANHIFVHPLRVINSRQSLRPKALFVV